MAKVRKYKWRDPLSWQNLAELEMIDTQIKIIWFYGFTNCIGLLII